jgi:hypothetical protein
MTSSTPGRNQKGMVIQERDRTLMKGIASLRVVDREQAKIIGGFNSTTRMNTRLLALTRAGLLRRFFLGATRATRKAVYALSSRGAALVGVPVRGPRRANNGALVADFFVLHQLAIGDIYCSVIRAASIPGLSLARWLSFHEPLTQASRLIPDGYFELQPQGDTIAAFLEVDLGHERLSVWRAKIAAYLQLAISHEYERRFGRNQFRVAVIANSDRRLSSIRKAVQTSTKKIFWFATIESIQSQGLLAPVWLRPDGADRESLIPDHPHA